MAFRKKYLSEEKYRDLKNRYDGCDRMLKSLEKSLISFCDYAYELFSIIMVDVWYNKHILKDEFSKLETIMER
jgi:hypothetical protein